MGSKAQNSFFSELMDMLHNKLKEMEHRAFNHHNSSVGRASAFGAGGRGFKSQPHHTKGVKNGTSSSLADAHIKGDVLGR